MLTNRRPLTCANIFGADQRPSMKSTLRPNHGISTNILLTLVFHPLIARFPYSTLLIYFFVESSTITTLLNFNRTGPIRPDGGNWLLRSKKRRDESVMRRGSGR